MMQLAYLMALMTKRFAPPPVFGHAASNPKILDMGCGDGSSTVELFHRYPHADVFGFDLHPNNIRQARIYFRNLPICFDYKTGWYPSATFDYIQIHRSMLMESGDIQGIIRECHRLLTNDGVVYIV
jgi:ubiquinone/menaquinone biosynthesis C-methylase UbiE